MTQTRVISLAAARPPTSSRLGPCLLVLASMAVGAATMLGLSLTKSQRASSPADWLPRDRTPNTFEAHTQFVMDYINGSTEANDVIFIGDSAGLEGVQPILFERLTGLRAYNLCSVGVLQLDGLTVVLRAYLARHPAPRLVVVCVQPQQISTPLWSHELIEIHEHFMDCFDGDNPARWGRAEEPIKKQIGRGARRVLGTITHRSGSHQNALVQGRPYTQLAREVAEGRGYWGIERVMEDGLKRSEIPGYPFEVKPELLDMMGALRDTTEKSGAKMMVRFMPVPLEGISAEEDPLRSWTSGVEHVCPNAIISRPEILLYDRTLFSDLAHLNHRGAEKLTALLADQIGPLLQPQHTSSQ